MLTVPDAIGVLRSLQAELRPDERERDEELFQALNVVLGEVKRLRKVLTELEATLKIAERDRDERRAVVTGELAEPEEEPASE